MNALSTLSSRQKAQLRDAFTIIDGDRDATITQEDLRALYATLALAPPSDAQLDAMVGAGINFTQYSSLMATELAKMDGRAVIAGALQVFAAGGSDAASDAASGVADLVVDAAALKEACCAVQLGEIGLGDHRLSRAAFDALVAGFVREELDGKPVFLAGKWLDAYVD